MEGLTERVTKKRPEVSGGPRILKAGKLREKGKALRQVYVLPDRGMKRRPSWHPIGFSERCHERGKGKREERMEGGLVHRWSID